MSPCWSLRVTVVCGLACFPLTLPAQEKSLPQQIADQLVLLAGGIHPGHRFMHAKGIVVTGTFTAAASAPSVSRAAHLQSGAVPVTVRFSDGTGVPNIPDTDPNAGPRGMKFVVDNKPLPVSFATLAYYGNNAFVFVNAKGTKRAGRYQIIPVAGLANLDSAAAAKAAPNYLFDDLPRRLARGPVQFRLYVQLANPGDQTNDGSVVWPDDRQRVELGTISLTTVAPNNDELQRSLTFNPIYLTAGIELSDDPIVPLRSAVYALSVAHRR